MTLHAYSSLEPRQGTLSARSYLTLWCNYVAVTAAARRRGGTVERAGYDSQNRPYYVLVVGGKKYGPRGRVS